MEKKETRILLAIAVFLLTCQGGHAKALTPRGDAAPPRFLSDLYHLMLTDEDSGECTGTFDCQSAGLGFHRDPHDCSEFYMCVTGRPSCHRTCPWGLHFDTRYNICNWPWALDTQCGNHDAPACGMPALRSVLSYEPARPKIVGGHEAVPGSWPWMVGVQLSGGHYCGGTLISDRWIVSAAHCFFGRNLALFEAVLGEHSIQTEESYEQRIELAEVIFHDDYDPKTKRNDIALLRLAEPARLNQRVSPACLPEEDVNVGSGSTCVVTGWGDTEEPETQYDVYQLMSDVLLEAEVPIVSYWSCRHRLPGYDVDRTSQVCAGYTEGGVDTCQGDSGGPLMCESRDGHWFLYGITSYGEGCAQPRTPAVYTRVPAMVAWIRAHTGDSSATYIPRAVPQAAATV
ncbi:trypsin-like isoform X2 [Branchiostoma lanceolatum]|uniref:trypsin-like isoform X2 n=1 Tax=Branchiostoma lanceolatum TaxID=7740 RepID=UPI003451AF95